VIGMWFLRKASEAGVRERRESKRVPPRPAQRTIPFSTPVEPSRWDPVIGWILVLAAGAIVLLVGMILLLGVIGLFKGFVEVVL
jgi:hypothetical protein